MNIAVTQIVRASRQSVMEFYSDTQNLKRISPRFPRLEIKDQDTTVIAGRKFHLSLDFIVMRVSWTSTIDTVVPGEYFVDTFSGSIVREWRHTHAYHAVSNGTRLTDIVALEPVWWCAPVVWLGVTFLFIYRKRALAKVFG